MCRHGGTSAEQPPQTQQLVGDHHTAGDIPPAPLWHHGGASAAQVSQIQRLIEENRQLEEDRDDSKTAHRLAIESIKTNAQASIAQLEGRISALQSAPGTRASAETIAEQAAEIERLTSLREWDKARNSTRQRTAGSVGGTAPTAAELQTMLHEEKQRNEKNESALVKENKQLKERIGVLLGEVQPLKGFPSLEEVKAAIPTEGVGVKDLVKVFKGRLNGRSEDFIALVKQVGKQDVVSRKLVPKE